MAIRTSVASPSEQTASNTPVVSSVAVEPALVPEQPAAAAEPAKIETPVIAASAADVKAEAPAAELPKVEAPSIEPQIEPAHVEPAAKQAPTIEARRVEPPFTLIKAEPFVSAAATPARKFGKGTYALIAASMVVTTALGAIAGAAVTLGVGSRPVAKAPAPVVAAHVAPSPETVALKNSVTQLSREVANLKTGINTIGRSNDTQFRTLADRLDRAEKMQEKAQAEPVAKIAKIQETLDRLERRTTTTTAAVTPPAQHAATPPASHDVTGSINTPPKPAALDGWRIVDIYGSRVLLQSRAGEMYEAQTGSTLPGVGRISEIKHEDGRVIVVTPKGVITAMVEQRRAPPYYQPYR